MRKLTAKAEKVTRHVHHLRHSLHLFGYVCIMAEHVTWEHYLVPALAISTLIGLVRDLAIEH